jgi:1-carboxybiuret hydrolase
MTELLTATEIAEQVKSRKVSARQVAQNALARIDRLNPVLNAFTDVTRQRALAAADAVDAKLAAGHDPGPMAGVPYAVKNLFDIKDVVTLAGSKINRDDPPAARDATLISRLDAAGAVLLGGLNMGEYAYDFTGENAHDGPSRNPHDPAHMAGGSSGGCGAAGASAMVPLSLGSDTNGSIRVPSSLCGLFGLKPTYGRLSRVHSFPFVASLDHLGPFARSTADLALSYDCMQGVDPADPMGASRAPEPVMGEFSKGIAGLRIAVAGGYFAENGYPEALEAVAKVAEALDVAHRVEIPMAKVARASAYVITMSEGAALHLERLRTRHADFDPDVRDRLLAGAMIPAQWVVKAHKIRRAFHDALMHLFQSVDILLAPATPCKAPKIGQKTLILDGKEMALRPNMGIFTQPISFAGLPVVAVPVWTASSGHLPIGVQVIAPPWREDLALRVAHHLETMGIASAPVARGLETYA